MSFSNIVHMYPQLYWHTPITIAADTEGIKGLIEVLQQSLINVPETANTFETMANDGEGYSVRVFRIEDPDKIQKLRKPYTDEDSRDYRDSTYIP